jgi:hypothetical protein
VEAGLPLARLSELGLNVLLKTLLLALRKRLE